jgi:N-acetyl-anhydromuramoyl-L-alanine amidase
MPFPEIFRPSPNFTAGLENQRLGVVFHHSVIPFEQALARLTDPASGVSYHCLIRSDGLRATLLDDYRIAHHAGVSVFQGRPSCNFFMLGLSFAGDTYREPLAEEQIESALEWLALRWIPLGWTSAAMTDHRQVAPDRKDDLHPREWDRLLARIQLRFEAGR